MRVDIYTRKSPRLVKTIELDVLAKEMGSSIQRLKNILGFYDVIIINTEFEARKAKKV